MSYSQDITKQFDVTSEAALKLDMYVELLLKWNKAKNLIGRSTEADIWQRHIVDSLQLVSLIDSNVTTISDFGAGAGLPGLVLAICLPDKHIHVLESNGKKTRFIQEACRRISIDNVTIHNERIEAITPWKSDVITARAFAPLPLLLDYIYPFYAKESLCLFPKGSTYSKERDDALRDWEFEDKIIDSLTDDQGVIMQIRSIKQR